MRKHFFVLCTCFYTVRLYAAQAFRSLFYTALSFLLGGEECIVCGKPVVKMPLCAHCMHERVVKHVSLSPRCSVCGTPLISEKNTCMQCRTKDAGKESSQTPQADNPLAFCFPVFPYRLWMKDLLFTWKMQSVRLFSPLFARIVFDVIVCELPDLPVNYALVPVPPRPGKFRKKGWDQVEDIASWLELHHHVPVMRLLSRRKSVEQKKLDKKGRGENAKKSFYVSEKIRKKITAGNIMLPERIVLLDDVRTTGTTLITCAEALASLGVKTLQAVVLFSVD
jgi:ComF family protein